MEELHAARLQAGHVDEVVERAPQAPHAVVHRAKRLELRLAHVAELLVDEHLQVAHYWRERRRQLVRDVPVELRPEALDDAKALVRGGQLRDLLLEVGDDATALEAQALACRVGRRRKRRPLPAEEAPDLAREDAGVDGLLHEAVAPHGRARVAVSLGGDCDDWHADERRLAPQAKRDLVAVEARNVQVHEDEDPEAARARGGPP